MTGVQTCALPIFPGQPPVTPPTGAPLPPAGYPELAKANTAIFHGCKIVEAPGGSKQIVAANGWVVVDRPTYDEANRQANKLWPHASAAYFFNAVQTAGDPNVGGNPAVPGEVND